MSKSVTGQAEGATFETALRALASLLHRDPDQRERIKSGLQRIAEKVAEARLSDPKTERKARRARIALFNETRVAAQCLLDVLETARPGPLSDLKRLLAPTLGTLFSTMVFNTLEAGITGALSERDIDSWRSRYRSWPEHVALQVESNAKASREEAARFMGDRLLRHALGQMIRDLDRRLIQEQLSAPDGRPVNWPRLVAFAGLWDLYAELARTRTLPRTPPQRYLALCAAAFPELGLDDTGLEDAAERAFRRTHERNSAGA